MNAAGPLAEALLAAQGWDGRTRALMLAGKTLPSAPDWLLSDAHRVAGCDANVFVATDDSGTLWVWSDSKIVRGVLALLIEYWQCNERDSIELADYLADLQLERFLSQSRGNGLVFVVNAIAALRQQ